MLAMDNSATSVTSTEVLIGSEMCRAAVGDQLVFFAEAGVIWATSAKFMALFTNLVVNELGVDVLYIRVDDFTCRFLAQALRIRFP